VIVPASSRAPAPRTSSRASETLLAAAFGPETATWPLPSATTPEEHWLRAVAAGGRGYYASAYTELAVLRRTQADGPLASLASSTRGSLLRQLGGHRQASAWDGRALWLADADAEATLDALVGLGADALGLGRFAAATTLLARAEAVLGAADAPPSRLAVRLAWVGAELAMAMGDGAAAVAHAHRGIELADFAELGPRHRIKSAVVLAAALCCSGCLDKARAAADTALDGTQRLGLLPLQWAVASLLAGIGSASHSAPQVLAIRDGAADEIRRRGGIWCGG
jgi:hypothetical protein